MPSKIIHFYLILLAHSKIISTKMAMGQVWGGDPIPCPCPVIPAPSPIPAPPCSRGNFLHPIPAPQGTCRYPPHPNMNFLFFSFLFFFFFFHSFWLNYMKQKNSISMTTIDLPVNQFVTNLFTSINLHETTIHA